MKWPVLVLIAAIAVIAPVQGCRKKPQPAATANSAEKAYGRETDWNDPQKSVLLNYRQAQGQRVFYQYCVWCHASSTPAGPSNISNLNPQPALANDGATLNNLSDEYLQNIITLGGSAMSKSALMPAWGMTIKQEEIQATVSFMRAIAQPPYHRPARPASQYMGKSNDR